MQITSSSIALQSQNSAHSLYEKSESLQVFTGNGSRSGSLASGVSIIKTEIRQQDLLTSFNTFAKNNNGLSLQEEANKLAKELGKTNSSASSNSNGDSNDPFANLSPQEKLKMLLIFMLLSRMQNDPKLMKALGLDADSLQQSGNNSAQQNTNAQTTASPVVEYRAQQLLYQSQTTQFSAQGQIKTADGQTIQIDVHLLMNSQTLEATDTKERLQTATKDPLVINLDGSAVTLSAQRFSFDLTGSGTKTQIPELTGNRAFLVLDKNQDGVVNNGTELFGPQSNDGFKELAQYDQDKNGWIDENDAVFKNLKLWINAGTNKEQLVSLKDAGIGAVYIGSATTTFNLQGTNRPQDTLGTIQSSGIFVKEDGSVGTIQHVDLSI